MELHHKISMNSKNGLLHACRMMINGVKMLNHKWAIADFTDGKYWGQILLKVSEGRTLASALHF